MHLRTMNYRSMIKRITLTFSSFCSILFFTSIHVERKKQEVKRDLKKTISPISYLTIERILVHVNGNFRSKGNIEITFRKTVKQIVKLICKPIKKLFRKDYGWRTKINPERGWDRAYAKRTRESVFSSGNFRATATLARSYLACR